MAEDERTLLQIDTAWLAELRRRCEAAGLRNVAKHAGMSRTTLWAALSDRKPGKTDSYRARATYGTVERARLALAVLRPDEDPMPPPFIAVGGPRSATWQIARAGKRRAKRT